MRVEDAQRLWAPAGPYVNTASFGLPPRPVWDALQTALAEWRGGTTSWQHWSASTGGARAAFARLVGVPVGRVATGATVSGFVGVLAASLPPGTRVLVPDVEFTSTLFPFLVQEGEGRARVRTVPSGELAEAIDGDTDVVACSAVQMSTGAVADLDAIAAAARHHGALTLVDATQACGWLPLAAERFDALACGAYKWLVSPRGSAFLAVSDALRERIVPAMAGWFAGADPAEAYCGPPLRLAADARELDTSPAWFSWVGTQPALELLEAIGVDAIHAHDVALADRFRAGVGLPPGDSAIVSADLPGASARLAAAGIVAPEVLGRLRVSWHVHNTAADVDRVLDVLAG